MVNKSDVVWAYRLLLGREPESVEIVDRHAHAAQTADELVQNFLRSREFKSRHSSSSSENNSLTHTHTDIAWDNYRCITYKGVDFTLPATDFTFRDLAMTGAYEPYVTDHMFARLSNVRVFVDVGANLGLFALPAAKKLNPYGHVYAFEASHRNANLLQQNVWHNSIKNVTVYPVGLGNSNGCAFLKGNRNSNNLLFDDGVRGQNVEPVPIVKLDSFWDKDIKIDMIKVDIEGYEFKFLEGASQIISNSSPIIYMEYSNDLQKRSSGVPGKVLLSKLIDFGYSFEILHRTLPPEEVFGSENAVIERIDKALAHHVGSERGTHLDLYLERKPDRQHDARPAEIALHSRPESENSVPESSDH